MSADRVTLKLHGDIDLDTLAQALGAWNGLLRELTREETGDPDSIRWNLVDFHVVCDRCGARRAADASGWTKQGADDVCPDCGVKP